MGFYGCLLFICFFLGCLSDNICKDDLSISCSTGCQLNIKLGTDEQECGQSIPVDKWPQNAGPTLELSGSCSPADSKIGVLMTDPDAPNCADKDPHYFLHWLSLNVPMTNNLLMMEDGMVMSDYTPPTPPPASGDNPPFHRYQFTAFTYSSIIKNPSREEVKRIMKSRPTFRRDFAAFFADFKVLAQAEYLSKNSKKHSGHRKHA